MHEADLADILNGNHCVIDQTSVGDFLNACQVHGMNALVAKEAQERSLGMPIEIDEVLTERFQAHRLFEILHCDQLLTVLEVFNGAGIQVLVLKGTALAYQIYEPAFIRSRGDTDILIREFDRGQVEELLLALGFEKTANSSAEHLSYQQSYERIDDLGFSHSIDVHWRLNNRKAFSNCFSFDEMWSDSQPLEALSPYARTLVCRHQMMHLCMHRVGHLSSPEFAGELTANGDRLLWLYDISLLSQRLSKNDWQQICLDSQEYKICSVIKHTLDSVQEFFPLHCPEFVSRELARPRFEVSRLLLVQSRFAGFLADLLVLPGWQKLALLKETLFPASAYMLAKYQKTSAYWLPVLYVRRFVRL